MYTFGFLPHTSSLQSIDGKPGFVKILADDSFINNLEEGLQSRIKDHASVYVDGRQQFVSARQVRDVAHAQLYFRDNDKLLTTGIAVTAGLPLKDVGVDEIQIVKGPSAMMCFKMKGKYGNVPDFSVDHVPSLKLGFWPTITQSWLKRDRLWPSPEILRRIEEAGCHVVPKYSDGGDEEHEWRLSFSLPEKILAESRSSTQNLVYIIFKCLFNQHIRILDAGDKYLTSYITKTVTLWAFENMPADMFTQSNTAECLLWLLEILATCLKERHLPHCFIPSLNILKEMPESMASEAHEKVISMMENLDKYIPQDVNALTKDFKKFLSIINILIMVLKTTSVERVRRIAKEFQKVKKTYNAVEGLFKLFK